MRMLRKSAFVLAACGPCLLQGQAQIFTPPEAKKLTAKHLAVIVDASKKVLPVFTPCTPMKPFVDWCRKTTSTKAYYLTYFVTRQDPIAVTYVEGVLHYNPGTGVFEEHFPAGGGVEEFMNLKDSAGHPFDAGRTKKVQVTLHARDCTLKYTQVSAGNLTLSVPLQSQHPDLQILQGSYPRTPNLHTFVTVGILLASQDIR